MFGCLQDFNTDDLPAFTDVEDDVLGHPPVLDLLLALLEPDIEHRSLDEIDFLPPDSLFESHVKAQPIRVGDTTRAHPQIDIAAAGMVICTRPEQVDVRGRIDPTDFFANRLDYLLESAASAPLHDTPNDPHRFL